MGTSFHFGAVLIGSRLGAVFVDFPAMTSIRLFSATMLMLLVACKREMVVTYFDAPQKVMSGDLEIECNRLYETTKNGKRLSWKGAVPVAFSIDKSIPAEFIPTIRSAMEAWNTAAGYTLFVIRDGASNTISALPADPSVRRKISDHLRGGDAQIATTIYSYQANVIRRSQIFYDLTNSNFSTRFLRLDSYDLAAVTMHELGHVLGLDHDTSSDFSIMRPTLRSYGFLTRSIDETSKRLLACEY